MKASTTLKTLAVLGLTSMTLMAGAAQADNGYGYGNYGGYPNANPWMNGQVNQQARFQFAMRERLAQLDQRQDAQMQRILAGMENGRLTMKEATGLLREHLAIGNLERKYLADGRLGPNELQDLEQRLETANRHIQFEKNDREQQRGGMDRPGDMPRQGDHDRR
ncbi:MAG: hypothetical protein HGA75_06535 [Thiobacillus sp.]|nr:hypothetical protein [Thiobacillus sp.]